MKLLRIVKSTNPSKKYDAFIDVNGKERKVSFGAANMKDFTLYPADEREQHKKAYLARHRTTEDWSDPLTAGFWSRWYLWNLPTKSESLRYIKERFNL
jgi:hypothetical protein